MGNLFSSLKCQTCPACPTISDLKCPPDQAGSSISALKCPACP